MKYPRTITKEWAMTQVCDRVGPMQTPCWVWLGFARHGYGCVKNRGKDIRAHRLFWTLLVGPIEVGHDIHHKCENKLCCNPGHLESMTKVKHSLLHLNVAGHNQHKGKTHCNRGHEFTGETTRLEISRGMVTRRCIPCLKQVQAAWWQKNHAKPRAKHYGKRNNAHSDQPK